MFRQESSHTSTQCAYVNGLSQRTMSYSRQIFRGPATGMQVRCRLPGRCRGDRWDEDTSMSMLVHTKTA